MQAAGHIDEELVAGGVAQAVVDPFQPVDVEEQHRRVLGAAFPASEDLTQAVGQQGPVGQAGERVVEGLVEQGPLGHLGPLALQVQVHEHGDLGPKDPRIERLRQVVHRSGGIPLQCLMGLPADGGQEDDGDVPASLPLLDVGGGGEAVEAGHLHIEKDAGEIRGQEALEGLVAGTGEHQVLAQGLEDLAQRHQVLLAVVDQEDAGAGIVVHRIRRYSLCLASSSS